MIDVLRWLVMAELLSLAALPLASWAFSSLPDRGFAFSKTLALILITWITWWVGSILPVGGNLILLWLVLLIGAVGLWWRLGRGLLRELQLIAGVLAVEEALFIAGFGVWCLMRSFHPDIGGPPSATTEKPMDLMFLQASSHSSSYPPQDLWLSGHGVNYYYFGYLVFATLGRLAGTSVLSSYNLALALIFALALTGTHSIAYNLTRSRVWSLLGPVFVVLLGNAHALFYQVFEGRFPWNQSWWYWESTRVVGAPGTTINEFPLFSLILGDLHPHVMAIPFVLLTIGFALTFLFDPHGLCQRMRLRLKNVALAAIVTGSLFATNTWDFPTYLLVGVGALVLRSWMARPKSDETHGDATQAWWSTSAVPALLLIGLAVAAYLPFYLGYHSPTGGIGLVTTITDAGQLAQIFGGFAIPALALIAFLSWRWGLLKGMARTVILARAESGAWTVRRFVDVIVPSAALLGLAVTALTHRWVLLTALLVAAVCWRLLARQPIRSPSEPASDRTFDRIHAHADRFAILLLLVAALLIAGTELVYVRDSFAGGAFYRMNTVFKFYYQAWILLGLVAAYGAVRLALVLRRLRTATFAAWICSIALVIGAGGIYTILGPLSYFGDLNAGPIAFQPHPLQGLETLESLDPDDFAAINWMRRQVHGNPVVLEATGGEYTFFGRVSTYTGLPTLLGWQGHEQQWRGNLPLLDQRHTVIDQIYSGGDAQLAKALLSQYSVSLVYVGPCERQVYAKGPALCGQANQVPAPSSALTKFGRFMQVVYAHNGVAIYRMPGRTAG